MCPLLYMAVDFYLRYYVGHKGRFGHEFIEFSVYPDGRMLYVNNSNYKQDTMITKEMRVNRIVREEICEQLLAALPHLDDTQWPEPNKDGRQELELILNGEHHHLVTCKIGCMADIAKLCPDLKARTDLEAFHYFVQDLKTLVLALVSAHFKIKPI